MNVNNALLERLLDVIEGNIIPLTLEGVKAGNKLFGAALLRKSDLSLVLAETNNEIANPLWHGEMHCLKSFYELPKSDRPQTTDLIFLSTHEPCSLCLSAITWAGFDNFFYLFSHEDSRDSFAIPHDLNILKEVFGLAPGEYRTANAFWRAHSIRREVSLCEPDQRTILTRQIKRISSLYDDLSKIYQKTKSENDIPLS
ncbi:MAG: nucleoside deaminase [Pseudomonadota bacterium]